MHVNNALRFGCTEEDYQKRYTQCFAENVKLYFREQSNYHYRMTDDTTSIGDFVGVPVGWDGKEAVTIQKHRRTTVPNPVDRAKLIN